MGFFDSKPGSYSAVLLSSCKALHGAQGDADVGTLPFAISFFWEKICRRLKMSLLLEEEQD